MIDAAVALLPAEPALEGLDVINNGFRLHRHDPTMTVIIASHARRSPSMGSVTSVRHRRSGWIRTRRRARRRCCPASRIGSPPGYARSRTSRPTAAPIAAYSPNRVGRKPASAREVADLDNPDALPTSAMLTPEERRARSRSARSRVSSSAAIRRARTIGPAREVTSPSCWSTLRQRLPLPHLGIATADPATNRSDSRRFASSVAHPCCLAAQMASDVCAWYRGERVVGSSGRLAHAQTMVGEGPR